MRVRWIYAVIFIAVGTVIGLFLSPAVLEQPGMHGQRSARRANYGVSLVSPVPTSVSNIADTELMERWEDLSTDLADGTIQLGMPRVELLRLFSNTAKFDVLEFAMHDEQLSLLVITPVLVKAGMRVLVHRDNYRMKLFVLRSEMLEAAIEAYTLTPCHRCAASYTPDYLPADSNFAKSGTPSANCVICRSEKSLSSLYKGPSSFPPKRVRQWAKKNNYFDNPQVESFLNTEDAVARNVWHAYGKSIEFWAIDGEDTMAFSFTGTPRVYYPQAVVLSVIGVANPEGLADAEQLMEHDSGNEMERFLYIGSFLELARKNWPFY